MTSSSISLPSGKSESVRFTTGAGQAANLLQRSTVVNRAGLAKAAAFLPQSGLRQASSIEERLFNSKALAKIATSRIAMHLDGEWRTRFFSQIDSLLDAEEWDPHDDPISEASFVTFLRMMIHLKVRRRPGLGATADGHLVAAWTAKENNLTVVCQPNDELRWVLSITQDGAVERAAGQTSIRRFAERLQGFSLEQWIG